MVNVIPTRTGQCSTPQQPSPHQRSTLEYYLVLFMLLALVILVIIVLWIPISGDNTLEFRRTSLTVIVTAFSAWIGAGAAYFFGKENLRVATESLKEVITPPKERLTETPVTVGAKKLDWIATMTDTVQTLVNKITDPTNPQWFIVVENADKTLNAVLKDDGVWRFISHESESGTAYPDIMNKKVKDVLDYVRSKNLPYDRIHVEVRANQTMEDADNLMDKQGCYLTIIVDDKKMPLSYLTTGEVRRFLLK